MTHHQIRICWREGETWLFGAWLPNNPANRGQLQGLVGTHPAGGARLEYR